MSETKRRMIGPISVPVGDLKLAGFFCKLCKQPVKVACQHVPTIAPRACLFGCDCDIGVIVWEDERQPNRRSWLWAMRLADRTKSDLLIFNGNRPTPPEFQGLN